MNRLRTNLLSSALLLPLPLLLLILIVVGAGAAHAQSSTTVTPDCIYFFTFGGNASIPTNGYPNYPASGVNGGGVCTNWVVSYTGYNVMGSPVLTFQSAPSATATTPGAFITYPGTIVTGINPNTSSTGAQTLFSNLAIVTPYVRLNLSGMTSGVISGVVYGYKTGFSGTSSGGGGSGCVGTAMTPCVVAGPDAPGAVSTQDPVQVAGNDGTDVRAIHTDATGRTQVVGASADGAAVAGGPVLQGQSDGVNVHSVLTCLTTAVGSDSSMGLTQIVALTAGQSIRVCKFSATTASPVTVQLQYGTGSNCAGGTANAWVSWQSLTAVAEDFQTDNAPLVIPASNALCLNLAAGTATTWAISYTKF